MVLPQTTTTNERTYLPTPGPDDDVVTTPVVVGAGLYRKCIEKASAEKVNGIHNRKPGTWNRTHSDGGISPDRSVLGGNEEATWLPDDKAQSIQPNHHGGVVGIGSPGAAVSGPERQREWSMQKTIIYERSQETRA